MNIEKENQTERQFFIIPRSGLCNRIRAIAAANRVSQLLGLSCVIVWWDWGACNDLFEESRETVLESLPRSLVDFPIQKTKLAKEGGDDYNQQFDFLANAINIMFSGHIFNDRSLPRVALADLKPYLPKPNKDIQLRVDALKKQLFEDKKVVGVHIRRTDHEQSIQFAPDELFIQEIDSVISEGYKVFLSSDNERTLTKFLAIFGSNIIINTKKDRSKIRWPKVEFDLEETKEDFIDLLLLASCEYVLGSYFSSYSGLAIVLNGHAKNRILKLDE